jgi:8-oxo-dGTP pyrophosphatase MutT (NUDIX family)
VDETAAREDVKELTASFSAADALRIVLEFDPGDDGLARKSRELTVDLLRQTASPFSRHQFEPGHITCTALVLHPSEPRVLLMHHHRLRRWLLPGGHVEMSDADLASAARREAREETAVQIDPRFQPALAGVDVHGIPANKGEPFHLHHDLIWCFRAETDCIAETDEAPEVMWATATDCERLGVAQSIRNSIERAFRV